MTSCGLFLDILNLLESVISLVYNSTLPISVLFITGFNGICGAEGSAHELCLFAIVERRYTRYRHLSMVGDGEFTP